MRPFNVQHYCCHSSAHSDGNFEQFGCYYQKFSTSESNGTQSYTSDVVVMCDERTFKVMNLHFKRLLKKLLQGFSARCCLFLPQHATVYYHHLCLRSHVFTIFVMSYVQNYIYKVRINCNNFIQCHRVHSKSKKKKSCTK